MTNPLFRSAPCPIFGCGRTDERELVLDRLLGWICLDHRPSLAPKPKQQEAET